MRQPGNCRKFVSNALFSLKKQALSLDRAANVIRILVKTVFLGGQTYFE
jgi:hypothetical protein